MYETRAMTHSRGSAALLAITSLVSACAESARPKQATLQNTTPAMEATATASAPATAHASFPPAEASHPLAAPAGSALRARDIALPGATAPASLDYIAVDREAGRVWVPVGNTGSVDVLEIASGAFTRVDGFAVAERDFRGTKRTVGPSAVSLGGGFAFIGDRASNEVCAIQSTTLKRASCVKLASATDGVAYVASSKEVWVTTPHDKSLAVLDASNPLALKIKTAIKVDGEPEGYAVDESHARFFTNLEDEGSTLVIDAKSHQATARWNAACGTDGPRGLAFDAARGYLFVACTDHVQVLDANHDGARLGRIDTGSGVDNLDYIESKGLLYAAAGRAARLSVIAVDNEGGLKLVASGVTTEGARNAVADATGRAYVADSQGARLLILGD